MHAVSLKFHEIFISRKLSRTLAFAKTFVKFLVFAKTRNIRDTKFREILRKLVHFRMIFAKLKNAFSFQPYTSLFLLA
jgi:hypothetical protein